MDLIRTPSAGLPVIRAYGDGGFRIANDRYEGAVLVTRDEIRPLALREAGEIGADLASQIAALAPRPDILIVGTGAVMTALAAETRGAFRIAAIAVETMATGAACRTFNVALAEGRRVAALLLPVG